MKAFEVVFICLMRQTALLNPQFPQDSQWQEEIQQQLSSWYNILISLNTFTLSQYVLPVHSSSEIIFIYFTLSSS